MKKAFNQSKFWILVAAMIVVPVVGYALMLMLTGSFHMNVESYGRHVVYALILIPLGLLIPYALLRIGMEAAHAVNPKEKLLRLKDIPKSKDQLYPKH